MFWNGEREGGERQDRTGEGGGSKGGFDLELGGDGMVGGEMAGGSWENSKKFAHYFQLPFCQGNWLENLK